MTVTLYLGDCLKLLPDIESGSIDAIITDLPYGTTACSWDTVISFEPMWEQVKRILKPKGAFVTTASQPFTSALVMSNPKWFRYEWIWDKKMTGNPFLKDFQPMKIHENILVFSEDVHNYYPNMTKGQMRTSGGGFSKMFNKTQPVTVRNEYFPTSLIQVYNSRIDTEHPTQKPVALYQYLISTYTNAGDTVMDFCMGSGTTGVAAMKLGRSFVGMELQENYFAIAKRRIEQAESQPALFQL